MPDGFTLLPTIKENDPNPYIGIGSAAAINRLHDMVNGLITATFDTSSITDKPYNVQVLRADDGGVVYKFIPVEAPDDPADENTDENASSGGLPDGYAPVTIDVCIDDVPTTINVLSDYVP